MRTLDDLLDFRANGVLLDLQVKLLHLLHGGKAEDYGTGFDRDLSRERGGGDVRDLILSWHVLDLASIYNKIVLHCAGVLYTSFFNIDDLPRALAVGKLCGLNRDLLEFISVCLEEHARLLGLEAWRNGGGCLSL